MKKIVYVSVVWLLMANSLNAQKYSLQNVLNHQGIRNHDTRSAIQAKGNQLLYGKENETHDLFQTENVADGIWDSLFLGINGVNGEVLALTGDESGRVYVGGTFTEAGGLSASRVARYNPQSNNWSILGIGGNNGANALVRAIAMDAQGNVYVGGFFTEVGGTNANYVARYNPQLNTWFPLGIGSSNGVNSFVYSIAIDDSGNVYVGGSFTQAGGIVANHVARYNPTLNMWSSLGTGTNNGVNSTVSALAVDNSQNVYVGGRFTLAGNTGAKAVARFNPQSNNWSQLGTGTDNGVGGFISPFINVIAVDASGDIFVGGWFSQAGGVNASSIARYNPNLNSWSALTGSVNGVNQVNALAIDATGNLYVGGPFNEAGGISANNVARFNLQTNSWSALGLGNSNGVNNYVEALFNDGSGKVYVGGGFTQAGGLISPFISRWNSITSRVDQLSALAPKRFLLEQNYPNPFNPSTTICYQLPSASQVSLKIYDVLGREVGTLVNTRQAAGSYNAAFNAANFASGIYFYRLEAGSFVQTKKMLLVK